jgi:hypothetical protein
LWNKDEINVRCKLAKLEWTFNLGHENNRHKEQDGKKVGHFKRKYRFV